MLSLASFDKGPKNSRIIARVDDPKDILPEPLFLWLGEESDREEDVVRAADSHTIYDVFREEGISACKVSDLDFGVGRSIKLCNDMTFKLIDSNIDGQPTSKIFIIAKSGAGKSTWISSYLWDYHKMFPKNPIFILSRKRDDPCFKKLEELGTKEKQVIEYIDVESEQYIDNFLTYKNFPGGKGEGGSMIVFDDSTAYPTKKMQQRVNQLRSDILQLGRSKNLGLISTSHIYNNYDETKIMYQETNWIVVSTSSQITQSKDCINKKLGIDKKTLNDIYAKLTGRFLAFQTCSPSLVISEHECHILKE